MCRHGVVLPSQLRISTAAGDYLMMSPANYLCKTQATEVCYWRASEALCKYCCETFYGCQSSSWRPDAHDLSPCDPAR